MSSVLELHRIPRRLIPPERWAKVLVRLGLTAGEVHGIQRGELEDQIAQLRGRLDWMRANGHRLAGVDWFWSLAIPPEDGRIGTIRVLPDFVCGMRGDARTVARHIGGRWRRVEDPQRGVWLRETEIDGVPIQIALGE